MQKEQIYIIPRMCKISSGSRLWRPWSACAFADWSGPSLAAYARRGPNVSENVRICPKISAYARNCSHTPEDAFSHCAAQFTRSMSCLNYIISPIQCTKLAINCRRTDYINPPAYSITTLSKGMLKLFFHCTSPMPEWSADVVRTKCLFTILGKHLRQIVKIYVNAIVTWIPLMSSGLLICQSAFHFQPYRVYTCVRVCVTLRYVQNYFSRLTRFLYARAPT